MTIPHTFAASLGETATIGRFIMDPQVASFGGSINNKVNRNSRICPGAKTSLYEQMVMLAVILRDYHIELIDSKEIPIDVDKSKHPLYSRVNEGHVMLSKRSLNGEAKQSMAPHETSTKNVSTDRLNTENSALFEEIQTPANHKSWTGFFHSSNTSLSPLRSNSITDHMSTAATVTAALVLHHLSM